jgi:hypothetical protein
LLGVTGEESDVRFDETVAASRVFKSFQNFDHRLELEVEPTGLEETMVVESLGMTRVGASNRPNWRQVFLRGSANEGQFNDMNQCLREYNVEDARLCWDCEGDLREDWN